MSKSNLDFNQTTLKLRSIVISGQTLSFAFKICQNAM